MKRYLLFGFDTYYPSGGWNDFINSFDTPVEAEQHWLTMKHRPDYYQLIDIQTGVNELFPEPAPWWDKIER